MVIKELKSLIYDSIVIYKDDGKDGFVDLYKGTPNEIPSKILDMNVRIIGAKKKGVLDIQVN